MCKVSIIVPIYKVEAYLQECLYSISNQSFNDFECILVDDGSPDKCGQICDEFAAKDSRFKVIHQENSGVSSARNKGIDIATGEYMCFVDSDDYWDKNLLEVAVAKADKYDVDVLCFDFRMLNGDSIVRVSKGDSNNYTITSEEQYMEYTCKHLLNKSGWAPWSKLFKTSIIKENKIYFYDRSKVFAEDLLFYLEYLLHADKIKIINDVLYNYIERDDSCTVSNTETRINEFIKLNIEFYKYLKKNRKKALKKQYYVFFYLIMSNRYKSSKKEKVLESMSNIKHKMFFRYNLIRVIVHSKGISDYLDINRNALVYENLQYYLYSSDNFLFRIIKNVLKM